MMASRLPLCSLLSIPPAAAGVPGDGGGVGGQLGRRGVSERRSMIARRRRWLVGVILAPMQREYASADCLQVAPLTARPIEPSHRCHHSHHQEGHQQDETHVLHGPLSSLTLRDGANRPDTLVYRGVQIPEHCIHRSLLQLVASDARPRRLTDPDPSAPGLSFDFQESKARSPPKHAPALTLFLSRDCESG
jgi:hypothetical protein